MVNSVDIAAESLPVRSLGRLAGPIGVLGVLGGVAFAAVQGSWATFFRSYLLNYCFVLSLALGALFFVMLQHVTRAGWSVAVRRLAEAIAAALPVLAILFVPLLVPVLTGMSELYPWSSPAVVAADPVLASKQAYLNPAFFIARCVVCLASWALLARYFLRCSVAQDADGDVEHTRRMERVSAPGLLWYAITVTFFSIDLLMSLNPHWYSTIWGVYFFSGGVVGFFALLVLFILRVQQRDRLVRVVTVEHFHDLGKLAFAFVVFWAYIAFSQYLLIWYANLPEETVWYQVRQGSRWWVGISLVLLFGHFVAPFIGLISRYPKRRPGMLGVAAVWLLAMHWLDVYYMVAPGAHVAADGGVPLHATDGLLLVGLGGIFLWAAARPLGRRALLPVRDPRLGESLAFENV